MICIAVETAPDTVDEQYGCKAHLLSLCVTRALSRSDGLCGMSAEDVITRYLRMNYRSLDCARSFTRLHLKINPTGRDVVSMPAPKLGDPGGFIVIAFPLGNPGIWVTAVNNWRS
jgi:hypothetical protein